MNKILSKFNTKKVLFSFSGIALVVLFSLFIQNYVSAAPKEGKKFGDWVVACEKDAKGKKSCFLSLTLTSSTKDKKDAQFVANFKLGYWGNPKKLQMVQILPFGISIPHGATIAADSKALGKAHFTTCQPFGCIAVAELKEKDIATLEKDKKSFVGVFSAEGQQINFPLSTKGLKEGIAALK